MRQILFLVFTCSIASSLAQSSTVRSSEFFIDLKNNKNVTADIPVISWAKPIPDVSFSQDGRISISFTVDSGNPLKEITIQILDSRTAESKGMQKLVPSSDQLNHYSIDKNLTLLNGENTIRVVAENNMKIKTNSVRKFVVGSGAIANTTQL